MALTGGVEDRVIGRLIARYWILQSSESECLLCIQTDTRRMPVCAQSRTGTLCRQLPRSRCCTHCLRGYARLAIRISDGVWPPAVGSFNITIYLRPTFSPIRLPGRAGIFLLCLRVFFSVSIFFA